MPPIWRVIPIAIIEIGFLFRESCRFSILFFYLIFSLKVFELIITVTYVLITTI